MKFKAYNKDNATNTRPRGCTIHFREDGAIFLSKEFVVIKEIEQGDTLSIGPDEEAPDNWYITFGQGNGFVLRCQYDKKRPSKTQIYARSSKVVRDLFKHFNYKGTSITLPIATEPIIFDGITFYQIMTAKFKKVADYIDNAPYEFNKDVQK